MSDETYFVTGATGFLGSCLVRQLVSQGKEVSIIVRDRKLNWRLQDIANQLRIFECDLRDPKLLQVVDKVKPDYIFHFAAYGALSSQSDAEKMIDVNIKGTLNLLHAVKQNAFKLCINTGSSAEYGIKNEPMKESDVLEPINDYGVVKAATTLLCQKEAVRSNLPINTLRLFSPYGYFEEQNRLIPWIITHALRDRPFALASPDNVRDFIFVEDVIHAYIQATKVAVKPGEVLNIGGGTQYSVSEVVQIVQDIIGKDIKPLWGEKDGLSRQIEPVTWQADIVKSKDLLGWEPKHTLREGLTKTIAWFRKNLNAYH